VLSDDNKITYSYIVLLLLLC